MTTNQRDLSNLQKTPTHSINPVDSLFYFDPPSFNLSSALERGRG